MLMYFKPLPFASLLPRSSIPRLQSVVGIHNYMHEGVPEQSLPRCVPLALNVNLCGKLVPMCWSVVQYSSQCQTMTSTTIGKKKLAQTAAEDSRPCRNEGMVVHVQAEVRRPVEEREDSDSDLCLTKLRLEARSKASSVSTSS